MLARRRSVGNMETSAAGSSLQSIQELRRTSQECMTGQYAGQYAHSWCTPGHTQKYSSTRRQITMFGPFDLLGVILQLFIFSSVPGPQAAASTRGLTQQKTAAQPAASNEKTRSHPIGGGVRTTPQGAQRPPASISPQLIPNKTYHRTFSTTGMVWR